MLTTIYNVRHRTSGRRFALVPEVTGVALKHLRSRRVLVCVHGYRNTYERVISSYEEIARRQRGFDATVGFVWPGSHARLGFWPAAARARRAGVYLASLVSALAARGAAVYLNAHSLGCEVVLSALDTLDADSVAGVALLAAATPADRFAVWRGANAARRVDVLRSRNDPVLRYLYRLATFNRALGAVGPHPTAERVHDHDLSHQITSHGAYKRTSYTYQLMLDTIDAS